MKSFKDSAALERSFNSDFENDGFDHIRSAMDTVVKTVSLGKDLVVGGAQIYNDIQAAGDAMASTSGEKRTSSERGIELDSASKKPRVTNVVQKTPTGFSSLNNIGTFEGIGASGTAVMGNKTSPPISMKLGKQLFSTTSIENFLSLFNQTGTISSSFGGRLLVPQDQRSRIYHCFRHNLHSQPTGGNPQSGITENAAYPSGANILTVQGDISIIGKTILDAPIQTCTNGAVYFAPYNKPDLEDVSFNLNKFKLGPVTTSSSVGDVDDDSGAQVVGSASASAVSSSPSGWDARNKIALLDDVNVMQTDKHRSDSAIYQNNSRAASFTSASSYQSAPFKYDAVLKQGIVDYLFMNKGIGPLAVEVVVYRVKANGNQGVPSKFSDFDLNDQLEEVISKGNFQKYLGGFGTDNLAPTSAPITGKRSVSSWYTEPDLPFLPSCRQIDQSELAYKEVQRLKVCLQPGERRPFQVKLGGEKYDPTSLVRRKAGGDTGAPIKAPILDKYSYVIALVANGLPQSRQVSSNDPSSTTVPAVLGDCFGIGDFQFTANYTEHVGAMSYKKCYAKHLFTNGNSPSMHEAITRFNNTQGSDSNMVVSTPVVIVGQSSATRTVSNANLNTNGGYGNVFS